MIEKKIYLKKAVISCSIGSDPARIKEVLKHFEENTGLKMEKNSAKKSIHGWARKGQDIGFAKILRGEPAMNMLTSLKKSNLLKANSKVNHGTITTGVPVYHQFVLLPFNPTIVGYGFQIVLKFAYTGSTVSESVRTKCRRQKAVSVGEVYEYINQLTL
jgi:ribosomal protein L5